MFSALGAISKCIDPINSSQPLVVETYQAITAGIHIWFIDQYSLNEPSGFIRAGCSYGTGG